MRRRARGSLALALGEASGDRARRAYRRLEGLARAGAQPFASFAFYARLMGEDGGRRALLSRLGPEAGDAIDEFLALALAFEQSAAPSLLNFLDEIESADISVKRDMEASGDSVRVMTIHAAKGLEAAIVFLPDTCGAPSGRRRQALLPASTAGRTGRAAAGRLVAPAQRPSDPAAGGAGPRPRRAKQAAGEHRAPALSSR